MKRSTKLKQLRSFLGMANFYRDSWARRSHILTPLTNLIKEVGKRRSRLPWRPEHENAFQRCKEAIAQEVLLVFPDFTKKFTIHTDASDYQLGAVISQANKPIAFFSRKLTAAQRNYSVGEREMLSIVETLREFRNILLGNEIEVFSDHENLTRPTTAHASRRIIRWRWLCEEFGPKLKFIPGLKNAAADALSRLDFNESEQNTPRKQEHHMFLTAHGLSNYEDMDFITPANEQLLSIGNLPSLENFGISEPQPYTHTCLNIGNEIMRVSPTEADTGETHKETHDNDIIFPLGPKKIASSQTNYTTAIEKLRVRHPDRVIQDEHGQWRMIFTDKNHIDPKTGQPAKISKVWIPANIRNDILSWYHAILCHPGQHTMIDTMSQHMFWRGMNKDIIKFVQSCPACQKRKSHRKTFAKLPLNLQAPKPWQVLSVDLVGPYKITDADKKKYELTALTMADPATGWFEIIELPHGHTGEQVALALDRTWFSRYPRPQICRFDNGREFVSAESKNS